MDAAPLQIRSAPVPTCATALQDHAATSPNTMTDSSQFPAGRNMRSMRDGGRGVATGNTLDPSVVPFHMGTMRHSLPSIVPSNWMKWLPRCSSTR
jgi:hypothetical protein